MANLIATFAADLARKAEAEVPAARAEFADDPRAFARWCAGHLQAFREQMTTEGFLTWAGENPDEVRLAIDAEVSGAARELDRVLRENLTELDRAHQAAEAAKRPVEPDTQRKPPSREQLLSPGFMSRDSSMITTAGAVSGRRRRTLRRLG
jgi:nucleoid-associated protein YgaU